jgi:hypothetical protein
MHQNISDKRKFQHVTSLEELDIPEKFYSFIISPITQPTYKGAKFSQSNR